MLGINHLFGQLTEKAVLFSLPPETSLQLLLMDPAEVVLVCQKVTALQVFKEQLSESYSLNSSLCLCSLVTFKNRLCGYCSCEQKIFHIWKTVWEEICRQYNYRWNSTSVETDKLKAVVPPPLTMSVSLFLGSWICKIKLGFRGQLRDLAELLNPG